MKDLFINLLKFALFILALPLVVGATVGFWSEIKDLVILDHKAFYYGLVSFLVLHLFIVELNGIYKVGQRVVGDLFGFFAPLVRFAPYFFPVYSIIVLVLLYFTRFMDKVPVWMNLAGLFAVGFTFALHLVYTARSLREEDSNVVKPNYFFSIAFLYLANIFLLALMLHLVFPKFLFAKFFDKTAEVSRLIYSRVVSQLF